jgi:1,4-alpha-glucan branching enzyme
MQFTVPQDQLHRIIYANHHDPHEVLGPHVIDLNGAPAISVRAFLPFAEEAWVVPQTTGRIALEPQPLERQAGSDFFEAQFPGQSSNLPYKLRVLGRDGEWREELDPYAFPPVLGDLDLFLFGEGNHYHAYEKLGAHVMEVNDVTGVLFAVWAPNALRVSVVGDFNDWDGRRNPMRVRGGTGVWELFLPGLDEGAIYKYEVKTRYDTVLLKADPQAFYGELRPKTASVVWNIDKHAWQDGAWMAQRAESNLLDGPMSIYEVHLASWMRIPESNGYLSYRDLAEKLCDFVKQERYTHIESRGKTSGNGWSGTRTIAWTGTWRNTSHTRSSYVGCPT